MNHDVFAQIKDLSAIVVALITAISVVLVAYINKYHERKIEQIKLEKEEARRETQKAKIELSVLKLFFSYDVYEFIDEQVSDLFQSTKSSRFLILFAINGKKDFNTATVIYEDTKDQRSRGAMRKYNRIPIDFHYRDVLKKTEKENTVELSTETLPENSLLKYIYTSKDEQVTHSKINFIDRMHVDDENDLLLYTSIGTHETDNFTPDEKHRIDLVVNSIKVKANNIKIQ